MNEETSVTPVAEQAAGRHNEEKRLRLALAGWYTGDAEEFLQLSEEQQEQVGLASEDFKGFQTAFKANHDERNRLLAELNERFPPPNRDWRWEICPWKGEPRLQNIASCFSWG